MSENTPEKPELATTELKLGGVTLKGSYIVWFAAIVSSAAGVVWAGGELWSDYKTLQENVAAIEMPDMKPVTVLTEKVDKIEKSVAALTTGLAASDAAISRQMSDLRALTTIVEGNDVQRLQGAIATLRTTVEQLQASATDTRAGVQTLARDTQAAVQGLSKETQTVREKMVALEGQMGALKKDVDSQWNALDAVGAKSLQGR